MRTVNNKRSLNLEEKLRPMERHPELILMGQLLRVALCFAQVAPRITMDNLANQVVTVFSGPLQSGISTVSGAII